MTQEIVTKSILTVGQSLCLVQSRRLVGDACICILNGCTGCGCWWHIASRPKSSVSDPTRRVIDSEIARLLLWLFTLRCASWRCVAARHRQEEPQQVDNITIFSIFTLVQIFPPYPDSCELGHRVGHELPARSVVTHCLSASGVRYFSSSASVAKRALRRLAAHRSTTSQDQHAATPTTRQARLPYSSSHRKAGSVGLALAAASARALRSGAAARCACLQAHARGAAQRRRGARGRLRYGTCISRDDRALPSWTAAGRRGYGSLV